MISSELALPEDSFTQVTVGIQFFGSTIVFPRGMVMIIHDMKLFYPESTGDHLAFRVGVSI